MPRIGHAGSFVLVSSSSGVKISNKKIWKETTTELLSNQFPFVLEAAKQKLYNQKSQNHWITSHQKSCVGWTSRVPLDKESLNMRPSFFHCFIASMHRKDSKKNTEQLGSVHYWFVQTFVEVSGTDQFLTKNINSNLSKKWDQKTIEFFTRSSQLMKHEVLSLHLRTSLTRARNS